MLHNTPATSQRVTQYLVSRGEALHGEEEAVGFSPARLKHMVMGITTANN